MYTNLGYIVYRTVLEYYSGDPDEDAFGEFLKMVFFSTTAISSGWEDHSKKKNFQEQQWLAGCNDNYTLTVRLLRFRYAKINVQRRIQIINDTVTASRTL